MDSWYLWRYKWSVEELNNDYLVTEQTVLINNKKKKKKIFI